MNVTPEENNTYVSSDKQSMGASTTSHEKRDPTWKHFSHKKEGNTNVYTCLHCNNPFRGGGINRMKQHLAGIPGNISACKRVPHDVRHQMQQLLKEIEDKKKNVYLNEAYDQNIEEEVQEVQPSPSVTNKGKRKAAVEISSYFAPRCTPGSQPSLKSVLSSKESVQKAKMAIARWFYDACIPFNAINSPYFLSALDAITAIGPSFKGPSYHELRVNLLGDCKRECQLLVEGYRSNWAKSGCTIMADGWSDQRQRTLINFLVYCPTGINV